MGVKREGGLLSKLSSTEKEGYLREGALILLVFLPLRCKKKH